MRSISKGGRVPPATPPSVLRRAAKPCGRNNGAARHAMVYMLLVFCVFMANCSKIALKPAGVTRVVSLAPSITETLFALGIGGRLVGVTTYCHYPPAADSIERVGGYVDANLERILTLEPNLVVLQNEHEKQRTFLERYGVPTLSVDYGTVASMCSSFAAIGRACGVPQAADSLIALFDSLVQTDADTAGRPKVLLCVGRDSPGAGSIQSIFAAGANTYYNDLIRAAGGRNAFPDSTPAYPRLSREGIITVAPDIVVDVAPAMGAYRCSLLVADWNTVAMVPAVTHNRVYCLPADYATVPGPRALLLLGDLKELVGRAEFGK